MTNVVIVDSAADAGSFVARIIADAIAVNPEFVLGVATGSTPLTTYRALAEIARREQLPLAGLTAFALDDYVGLPVGHPEGYKAVIDREVVDLIGLRPERVHVPDGDPERIETTGETFERMIREAGGIDLQLLGIGTTGHIGFNEPGSPFDSRTRVTELEHRTRVDNARFFSSVDEVPTHAVTQGVGTILDARRLVMMALGEHKAEAVARAVEGEVDISVPGSALQLHADATVVVDEAAASRLRNVSQYQRFSSVSTAS